MNPALAAAAAQVVTEELQWATGGGEEVPVSSQPLQQRRWPQDPPTRGVYSLQPSRIESFTCVPPGLSRGMGEAPPLPAHDTHTHTSRAQRGTTSLQMPLHARRVPRAGRSVAPRRRLRAPPRVPATGHPLLLQRLRPCVPSTHRSPLPPTHTSWGRAPTPLRRGRGVWSRRAPALVPRLQLRRPCVARLHPGRAAHCDRPALPRRAIRPRAGPLCVLDPPLRRSRNHAPTASPTTAAFGLCLDPTEGSAFTAVELPAAPGRRRGGLRSMLGGRADSGRPRVVDALAGEGTLLLFQEGGSDLTVLDLAHRVACVGGYCCDGRVRVASHLVTQPHAAPAPPFLPGTRPSWMWETAVAWPASTSRPATRGWRGVWTGLRCTSRLNGGVSLFASARLPSPAARRPTRRVRGGSARQRGTAQAELTQRPLRAELQVPHVPLSSAMPTARGGGDASAPPPTFAHPLCHLQRLVPEGGSAPRATVLSSVRDVSAAGAADGVEPKASILSLRTGREGHDCVAHGWQARAAAGEEGDGAGTPCAALEIVEPRRGITRLLPFPRRGAEGEAPLVGACELASGELLTAQADGTLRVWEVEAEAARRELELWRRMYGVEDTGEVRCAEGSVAGGALRANRQPPCDPAARRTPYLALSLPTPGPSPVVAGEGRRLLRPADGH